MPTSLFRGSSVRGLTLAFVALAGAPLVSAFQGAAPLRAYPELGLTLALPGIEDLVEEPADKSIKASFSGRFGNLSVAVHFNVREPGSWMFAEPEDVSASVRADYLAYKDGLYGTKGDEWSFEPTELAPGKFGWAPHAALFSCVIVHADKKESATEVFVLSGLLEKSGYSVEIAIEAQLSAEQRLALLTTLRQSIQYTGKERDPRWTDAEATARWNAFAPPSHQMKLGKLVRTAHYIVMSNASGAERYGKKLEERYAAFKKLLNFQELPSHRLLPVFYMRTGDEMRALVAKKLDVDDPQSTIDSFQELDYLVTSADSNDDYEEAQDLAYQLWFNRVRADGGGLWMRVGLGTLFAYPASTMTITASELRKGRNTPLPRLLDDTAWDGQSNTEMNYGEQCAFFVQYLRESKTFGPKFEQLVRTLGTIPDEDTDGIEKALTKLLQLEVKALEKGWLEWCAKRKK